MRCNLKINYDNIDTILYSVYKAAKQFEPILFNEIKSVKGVKYIKCIGNYDYVWEAMYVSRNGTYNRTGVIAPLSNTIENCFTEYCVITKMPLKSLDFFIDVYDVAPSYVAKYNKQFFKNYK